MKIPRRHFLRGSSGALLAVPVLTSLWPRAALAAKPAPPRRFIAVKSYSSQRVIDWYPRFEGQGYQVRPFAAGNGQFDGSTICPDALPEAHARRSDGRLSLGHRAKLVELAAKGGISSVLGARPSRYARDLTLIRGLDFMPDTSHNDGGMLGNYAGATVRQPRVEQWPTIDQVLAFSPRFYPAPPAGPRSLHLSLGQTNTCSYTHNGAADGDIVQVQAHTDPRTAFYEVFGQAEPAARARSRTLVDQVLEDLKRTERDPRLGTQDRQALERHVALLHELEVSLHTPLPACQSPTQADVAAGELLEADSLRRTCTAMIEIALGALRCDLTRVVTFDVWQAIGRGQGANGEDLAYAHNSAKGPRDWHERVHEFGRPEADRQVLAINQWIADEVFTTLLDGLSITDTDGQRMLDHSLVFWGNELGMNHHNYSVPALLAGSADGRIATGQYLDYIDWDAPIRGTQENAPIVEGVPHNRLLVSLLRALGLRPEDYERPGQPGYGSYSTAGKSARDYPIDYDASRHGDPLPGLLRA